MKSNSTQIVFLDDDLDELLQKGELNRSSYNPRFLFKKTIFIQLFKKPKFSKKLFRKLKMDARIIYLPLPKIIKHAFILMPFLTSILAKKILNKIADEENIQNVSMIRIVGHGLALQLGVSIKPFIQKPILASLHGNPDIDYLRGRRSGSNPFLKTLGWLYKRFEEKAWKNVDHVFGVYEPVRPYLEKYAKGKYTILPNIISSKIIPKTSYFSQKGIRIVNVGRQENMQKDPRAIIEAVERIPFASLTCFGNGKLHNAIQRKINSAGLRTRIQLISGLQNEKIVKNLREYDIFVYQSDNFEISKGCIEAALAGLPVILNHRDGGMAKEIDQVKFYLVENSSDGFHQGITKFAKSTQLREKWGKRSQKLAKRLFDPKKVELRHVELIKRVLKDV